MVEKLDKSINLKVKESEFKIIKDLAEKAGERLATYVREAVNTRVKRDLKKVK